MSDDLVAFLRARLDEEQEVANRENRQAGKWWDSVAGDANSVLVSMFSPARVLRDVESKRGVVQLYENALLAWRAGSISERNQVQDEAAVDVLDGAARLLALSWADHPDYRETWRP